MKPWMIYGAYGYTGKLIAELAKTKGLQPILSGRDLEKTKAMAEELGFEYRCFSLDDKRAAVTALKGIHTVAHCAGPFYITSRSMLDACIEARVNYLDITGEIEVFEEVFKRDKEIKKAGIIAIPGSGFDVVPTDCLAAMLKEKLHDANYLELAFSPRGSGVSPGTLKTMVGRLGSPCQVRRDGKIVDIPHGWSNPEIPFGQTPVVSTPIPWGDVSTAFYSTGIPNIDVFIGVPTGQRLAMATMNIFSPIIRNGFVQKFLMNQIEKKISGPDLEQRKKAKTLLWGRVTNNQGKTETLRMETPEGYNLTAEAVIAIAGRVNEGLDCKGATTPSMALGATFVLSLPGVKMST